MREHLGFLKTSSTIVKVAAWVFLFLGVIGGISIILGLASDYPRWMGIAVLAFYVFFFFFLYIIAKISDLLIKIIEEIHSLKKE